MGLKFTNLIGTQRTYWLTQPVWNNPVTAAPAWSARTDLHGCIICFLCPHFWGWRFGHAEPIWHTAANDIFMNQLLQQMKGSLRKTIRNFQLNDIILLSQYVIVWSTGHFFLREWIKKQNGIPAHKIGKLWKFKKSELDEWVKSGKSAKWRS